MGSLFLTTLALTLNGTCLTEIYQPVHHAHAISQQNNYGMRRGRSEVHNNLLSYGSPLIRSVQSPTISSNTSKSAQTNFTRTFGSAGQPQWMGNDGVGTLPAGTNLIIGPSNILTPNPALPTLVIAGK